MGNSSTCLQFLPADGCNSPELAPQQQMASLLLVAEGNCRLSQRQKIRGPLEDRQPFRHSLTERRRR